MSEWHGSEPEEIIDRLGQANEALVATVRQAHRATDAARSSEHHYRGLFEAIDDGFCVVEVLFDAHERPYDYRFLEVNPAFGRHTGLTDVHGKTIGELRAGQEQRWFDIYGAVALTGRPVHFSEHAAQIGNRWFQVSAFALGEAAPFHVGVLFRDITEERAERERRRLLGERHEFLLRLGDTVRSLGDAGEIQTASLRLLAEHLGLSRCGYGDVDADEVVTIAHDFRDGDMPRMTGTRRMADYDPALMEIFRSGGTLVVDDVGTDPRMQDPEVARVCAQARIGALLEAPLMSNGRLCAIMFAHQREARQWSEDEIALVQDVAERTWAMVERARSADILRASEARNAFVLELSDALRPLDDPAEIPFETAVLLGRHLGVARCVYGEFEPAGERFTVDREWTDGTVAHLAGPLYVSEFGDYAPALLRGDTIIVDDALADRRTDPEGDAFDRIGQIRSTVAVPLIEGGTLKAAFAVQDTQPRHWSTEEIALVEEVASRTWASMQRAHTKAALEEIQTRAAIALEAADMGSFVWYPEEDRAECDAKLMDLYGLDPGDTLNLEIGLTSVFHPDDHERLIAAVERACDPDGDGRLVDEYRVSHPNGDQRLVAVNGRTSFGGPGQTTRMHGVVIDITERRRAEERAREEREERERREQEFAANAAHELRTPLTGILAAMDALDAGAATEPEERGRFLTHIRGAAERMTRLSDSLLLLARGEGEQPTEPVAVRQVLHEVAAALEPGNGVRVEVRAPEDLVIETNPGLLERILANLGENAAAHTSAGSIELRAAAVDGTVELTIANSGERIDPEVARRAFDRFYRGPGGNRGFGLGLAIAAQAASAIGGELTVVPGEPAGTVARLTLPADARVSLP